MQGVDSGLRAAGGAAYRPQFECKVMVCELFFGARHLAFFFRTVVWRGELCMIGFLFRVL